MTNEKAIALLETGSKLPSTPHTAEMLDEACKLACRALNDLRTSARSWASGRSRCLTGGATRSKCGATE